MLILYAIPHGELGRQLREYFRNSEAVCRNRAHDYFPHCSLTGFFRPMTTPQAYVDAFQACANQEELAECEPIISGIRFSPKLHQLKVEASSWEDFAKRFLKSATAAVPGTEIRTKTGLHVSLAYGFPHRCDLDLRTLAKSVIDPCSPVSWSLELYERTATDRWVLHATVLR